MRTLLLCCFCFCCWGQDGLLLSEAMRGQSFSKARCDDSDSRKDRSSSSSSSCSTFLGFLFSSDDDDDDHEYYSGGYYDGLPSSLIIAPVFAHTVFANHEIDHINQGGVSIGVSNRHTELSLMFLSGPITFQKESLANISTDNANSVDFIFLARFFPNDHMLRPYLGVGFVSGYTTWDFQQSVYADEPIDSDSLNHYSAYLSLGLDFRIDQHVHLSIEAQTHALSFDHVTNAGFVNDVFNHTNSIRYLAGLRLQF